MLISQLQVVKLKLNEMRKIEKLTVSGKQISGCGYNVSYMTNEL